MATPAFDIAKAAYDKLSSSPFDTFVPVEKPKDLLEPEWGAFGAIAYPSGALIMAARNPIGVGLTNIQKQYLRPYFDNLVDRVVIHYNAVLLNELGGFQGSPKIPLHDTAAQTFGLNIYISAPSTNSFFELHRALAHELFHAQQYEQRGSSLASFGRDFFAGYYSGGLNELSNPIEVEAYDFELNKFVPNVKSIISQYIESGDNFGGFISNTLKVEDSTPYDFSGHVVVVFNLDGTSTTTIVPSTPPPKEPIPYNQSATDQELTSQAFKTLYAYSLLPLDGDDLLLGDDSNDVILGRAGNDILDGKEGNDRLYGEAGNDGLLGGTGDDTLDGGTGNDELRGEAGNDLLVGGAGDDRLDGGTGADIMQGQDGNDTYIVDDVGDRVIEYDSNDNDTGGVDTVQSLVSYVLPIYVENLTLTGFSLSGDGNASNNILVGNDSDNILRGFAGNDFLDGGIGNDALVGGIGDDSYFVDSMQDVVIEASGEGIDRVYAAVNNWILGETVENLTLVDNATIGFGNNLNNDLVGNSTKDDILSGGLGNDILNGRGGNDYLNGGNGDDVLDGGIGADILEGGTGDDIYIVDNPGDVIIDTPGTGIETVRSSVSWTLGTGLDNLTLIGTDAINGTGNTINNIITGNSAANILDGGIGNDTLIAETGDDTYIVDNINDIVREYLNEGIDTVQTSLTWTLDDNVENLVLLGTAAINGTGNALNNVITGNSAANILNGSTGNDTLIGGDGNDTYIVDSLDDIIIDTSGTGIETVQSSVSWTLGTGLDNLVLTGAAAINGTGNTLNNRIVGNSASNILDGGIGDDTLEGGLGDDIYIVDSVGDTIIDTSGTGLETVRSSVSWTLSTGLDYLTLTGTAAINGTGNAITNTIIGNSNNNSLNGGLGNDTLTGGDGADSFVFDTGTAFTSEIGVDRITDFLVGTDKIILGKSTFTALSSDPGGALNANEFATINDGINGETTAAASTARIVFNQFNGDLFYNQNGSLSGLGTGGRFATLAGVTTLTANSFAIQA
jgi:Ca2+-binding RTX toxin-like protein